MQYEAIKLLDQQWSHDVQNGLTPFDENIARAIHKLYQIWWNLEGNDLPKASLVRAKGEAIVNVDIEELIQSVREAAEGKTVTYTFADVAYAMAKGYRAPLRSRHS